jgi:hypothetical protein
MYKRREESQCELLQYNMRGEMSNCNMFLPLKYGIVVLVAACDVVIDQCVCVDRAQTQHLFVVM